MKYVVDRIEGVVVVCETSEKVKKSFSMHELFPEIKEGDHFEFISDKCIFLREDTLAARNKNILLQRKLFEE
ncbi:MAG: DUF3006 domain-containing protein [Oscillospiraceae bacterium]